VFVMGFFGSALRGWSRPWAGETMSRPWTRAIPYRHRAGLCAPPAGPHPVGRAGEAELAPLRQAYWARVAQAGVDPAGKLFIDRQPLNTLNLPLISSCSRTPRFCSSAAIRATRC
jgi:hypothetical protein